jgi:hypothetical protein
VVDLSLACTVRVLLTLAVLVEVSEAGQILDMRNCPLNTLTFVDPWADGEFQVTRVGRNYQYLCAGGLTSSPPSGERCLGPYGDLIFEGELRNSGGSAPETVFAVFHTYKAVPCCGWSVLDKASGLAATRREGFQWLEEEQMPTLRTVGFAGIGFDEYYNEGRSIFGNPKYATRCELTDAASAPVYK